MKKRQIFKKGPVALFRDALGTVLFTLAVIAIIAVGLGQAGEGSRAEGLRLLDESIRRAVTECYALEGRYPESIEYIEETYGLIIDRSKYVVLYNVFASNLLPDIRVVDVGGMT